ncbi:MAG: hypothetical protein ABJL99_04540 [Aliishimia sp.]
MEPYQIEHLVDVIGADGQIDQVYNCLIYKFEGHGAYIWARAYVDEMHVVSIYGPFKSSNDLTPVDNPDLLRDVIDYLRMRFGVLQKLGLNGYVKIV